MKLQIMEQAETISKGESAAVGNVLTKNYETI